MKNTKMQGWPWNNRPSSRHQFKEISTGGIGGHSAKCQRCGSVFVERADTTAAVYCYPSKEWMAEHPHDDGALGVDATGRPCGEYGRPL